MALRFASLGSGSEGNAWLIEKTLGTTTTRVMVDCGFTLKETVSRLARLGLEPQDVDACIVTHEHDDHIGGVFKFSRKFNTQVWLTRGSWRAALEGALAQNTLYESGQVRLFDPHFEWSIGDLRIQPFPVPHDANEPAQMVLTDGVRRLGLITDCGKCTPHIVQMLSGCDALVLESNHDSDLLKHSSYPPSLKRRISGDYGHLSNDAACEILSKIDRGALKLLVAAHLSQNTNSPEHVRASWSSALGGYDGEFSLADQGNGLDWRCV